MVDVPDARSRHGQAPSRPAAAPGGEPRYLPLLDAELPLPDGRLSGTGSGELRRGGRCCSSTELPAHDCSALTRPWPWRPGRGS